VPVLSARFVARSIERVTKPAINAAGSTLPKNLPYPPIYSKVNPADTPDRHPGNDLADDPAPPAQRPCRYAAGTTA
jgi:hypothetical protein